MVKRFEKVFKNLKGSPLTLGIGILAAIFIVGGGIYFLVLPQYSSLQEIQEENRAADQKVQNIKRNLAEIKKLDKENLATYSATVDKLLPDEPDHVRVATLLQVIANAVGGTISNIQASNIASNTKPSSAPTTGTTAPSQKQTIGDTTKKAPISAAQGAKNQTYEMSVIFTGNYESLKRFLEALKKADRVVDVKNLEVSGTDGPNRLKSTLSLIIPYMVVTATTIQPEIPFTSLSRADEREIEEWAARILYSGNPAKDPVSRSNPFANF